VGLRAQPEPAPGDLLARLADGAALSRRYAFLARDLLAAARRPVLAAEYRKSASVASPRSRRLPSSGVRRGDPPIDEREVADLVQAVWIIAETWLAFGELDGTYVRADDGARLLRVVLRRT